MDQQNLQEIEISIEDAKKVVAKGTQLDRLFKNRDFRQLVLTDLFETRSQELVMSLAQPAVVANETIRKGILKEMDMIAGLRMYFVRVRQDVAEMEQSLAYHEAERELETSDSVA